MRIDPLILHVLGCVERGTRNLHEKSFHLTAAKGSYDHSYLHMSSITQCGRLLWMKLHGLLPPDEHDTRTIRIFDAGHLFEDYVIKLMTFGGATILSRQEEYQDFSKLIGHSDAVIEYNGPAIVDIKTMNQKRAWEFAKADLQDASNPFFDYFTQVNLYMAYRGTRDGLLLVYNKNTSDVTARRVDYDQKTIDFHMEKAAMIILAEDYKKVPDGFTAFQRSEQAPCLACPARARCYAT